MAETVVIRSNHVEHFGVAGGVRRHMFTAHNLRVGLPAGADSPPENDRFDSMTAAVFNLSSVISGEREITRLRFGLDVDPQSPDYSTSLFLRFFQHTGAASSSAMFPVRSTNMDMETVTIRRLAAGRATAWTDLGGLGLQNIRSSFGVAAGRGFTFLARNVNLMTGYALLEVTYVTHTARPPTGFTPTSGTLNPTVPLTFSWAHSPSNHPDERQLSSTIERSINNGAWIPVTISNAANTHTFPAGTFPQGAAVRLRVRTTSTVGVSDWSNIFNFTTLRFTLPAPRNFFPSSGRLAAGEPNFFTWEHTPSESHLDAQVGSFIEVSVNNGAWARTVLNNTANSHTFPANSWPQNASVRIRVLTRSNTGFGEIAESPWTSNFNFTTHQTNPPTTLMPDDTARNPRQTVEYTWQHVSAQGFPGDTQRSTNFRRRTNNGAWVQQTLNNALNTHTTPPNTFANGNTVQWQVQTVSNAGVSEWSETAGFTVAVTPPFAPLPVFPVNISITPAGGVQLSWNYNSPYDSSPSRFDIEFSINNGPWQTRQTAGQVSILLPESIFPDEQSAVRWRVRGYGEFSDIGPWSNTVTFWTRGVPPRPSVTCVSNSNRPVITFSAQGIMSYELEVLHRDERVYFAARPFVNVFTHTVGRFLANGTYAARIRVGNEYGLFSNWAELAFTINVEAPPAVIADVSSNNEYAVDVFIEGGKFSEYSYFVYRAEEGEGMGLAVPIGRAADSVYRDFTAAPGRTYLYFVRTVDGGLNFADSNFVTARYERLETMLAPVSRLSNVLVLSGNIGSPPRKEILTGAEREFVKVLGREHPVIEVGANRNRKAAHTFFVSADEARRLKEWSFSTEMFCLRDRRYGTMFGTFAKEISILPEVGGFAVSFEFAEADWRNMYDI